MPASDPLQDINNTRKIAAVAVGGKFFDKPALQNIFAQVEALEALHRAAVDGEIEQVKSLISKGADVNDISDWNWTLLHGAAENGYKEMVEFLIAKGANVNVRDGASRTPLWHAEKEGHTEIAEMLRKHGAKE